MGKHVGADVTAMASDKGIEFAIDILSIKVMPLHLSPATIVWRVAIRMISRSTLLNFIKDGTKFNEL
jgi:hypothetical protein